MWIRSQDKRSLAKVIAVGLDGTDIYCSIGSGENGNGILAKYDSKERAIEVLDLIQNQLTNCIGLDVIKGTHRFYKATVFQMPEK